MIAGTLCKKPDCDNAAKYPHSEKEPDQEIEGYCSLDCMVTDLRKLKCPVCNNIMEFDSETAFFNCNECSQKMR